MRPEATAHTMKLDTVTIAIVATMARIALITAQKVVPSALYLHMEVLAAALRGKIYAHHETEKFCVQKVGKSRNMSI